MSYRGRGRGGPRRDDRREAYQPPPPLSPDERLREVIIHYGDVDAVQELERVAQQIRVERAATTPALAESFRFAVTEQPFKIPYYAALLRSLYEPVVKTEEDIKTESEAESDDKTVGAKILDEFVRGFLSYLDSAAWRETRFCVHFFAHLAVLGVITAQSFGSLVQALTAVLDEFGVSAKRAKNAALCAAEGLMRAGALLTPDTGVSPPDIIGSIQAYVDSIQGSKAFVSPLVLPSAEASSEVLDQGLAALQTLVSCNFAPEVPLFPTLPPQAPLTAQPYALPSILVPPEALPAEFTSSESDPSTLSTPHKSHGEWPEYALSLFEPGATPSTSPSSPASYLVRSGLAALIDIFEVNRKEAVRLLLEFPKWCPSGTFRPPPSKDAGTSEDETATATGPQWILEPTIIETILSLAFMLPEPAGGHKLVYYATLISEFCKAAPTSGGPAVGKAIRRLYSLLGDTVLPFSTASDGTTYTGGGLDVDIARRFAEWFAVHMSNFGFGWVWKEWASDLTRYGPRHPKRVFIHRAVELEIRLAYYDRVMKTLPDSYREPEYRAIPLVAPGPAFEYEESTHERYDLGTAVLEELKARKDATEVLGRLDALRNTLESEVGTGEAQRIVRDVAVQSLLHVGARSFSHLLNALEKYLPVLRALAGSENQRDREKRAAAAASASGGSGGILGDGDSGWGGGEDARQGVLQAAAKFWRYNGQMVGVVFDKLMQYQIVDPHDVVAFAFAVSSPSAALVDRAAGADDAGEEGTIGTAQWDLVRAALDKANGRVVGARRRVAILRKEAEERRARAKAAKVATGPGEGMDVDGDADSGAAGKGGDGDEAMKEEDEQEESPVLATARKTLTALTREQRIALLGVLQAFVRVLVRPAEVGAEEGEEEEDVISAEAWEGRERWGAKEWSRWETWGWYKQFCRLYSPYLRLYSQTLSSIAFAGMAENAPSAAHVKKWWNIAVLEEA